MTFGYFTGELEAYQFLDWLLLWVAPRKRMNGDEAYGKAQVFIRDLRNGVVNASAIATLEKFREWRQTNPPINWLNQEDFR